MASTELTDFLAEVLPEVPGCPESLAVNAVRNALIELCERAKVWRYEADPQPAFANEGSYDLEPQADTETVEIVEISYDGTPLKAKTSDQLKAMYGDWRVEEGNPEYYTQDNEDAVIIVPRPASSLADAIKMVLSLRPTPAATAVDSRLYSRYHEIVSHGALYRLLSQDGRPWANATLAASKYSLWEAAVVDAHSKASRGYVRAARRVSAGFF